MWLFTIDQQQRKNVGWTVTQIKIRITSSIKCVNIYLGQKVAYRAAKKYNTIVEKKRKNT